jgi:hypothetical protein
LTKGRRDEGVRALVRGEKASKHNMLTVDCVRQAVDGERKIRKMLRAWGVEKSDKEKKKKKKSDKQEEASDEEEDESEEEVIIADQPEANAHERRQEPPRANGRPDAPRAEASKKPKPKPKRMTATRVGSRNPRLPAAAGDVDPGEGAEEDDEA